MTEASATLLILVQVVTDVDLLAPIVAASRRRGVTVRGLLRAKSLKKTPELDPLLRARCPDVDWEKVDEDAVVAGKAPKLAGVTAVIAATESTAPAHKTAHALARRANEIGIATATLQHGHDNVGLTWFDAEYPPESVRFASRTIFTWGPLERLHRDVLAETRAKCIAVGCSKPARAPRDLPPRPGTRARLVAVFENLHWSRYDDAYRKRFLADLEACARRHADTTFFVRPHPAGQWLTKRFDGPRPSAENLLIAPPGEPKLARYDAPALIELADGIVTTPSTIALDAARRSRPAAVAAYGLQLADYAPLKLLENEGDWSDFAAALSSPTRRAELTQLADRFAAAAVLPGDAAARIVDHLLAR